MINLNRKTSLPEERQSSGLRFRIWGIILVVLLIFAIGIYCTVRRTALRFSADYYYPFLKAARAAEDSIAAQALMGQSKHTLAKALRNLRLENDMLAAERTVVSDLKKENAELRSLLGLKQKGAFRPVFAEVLARNPMTWQEQFTIDKGSGDGIEPGNPVVCSTLLGKNNMPAVAVIGKVKSVTRHTAVVSTVLSQDFKMAVSLPGTKSSGILEGAHNIADMRSTLKFLPLNTTPVPGQIVYTNAFSGNSPPGLPVGSITGSGSISKDSPRGNLLYLEAGVQPFESPAEVRFVAVYVKDKS